MPLFPRLSLPRIGIPTSRAIAAAVLILSASHASAQVPQAPLQPSTPTAGTRRVSIDDAVRMALENNLGLQVERLNPQIQDLSTVQIRSSWLPSVVSSLNTSSTNNPSTSALQGGQTKVTDSRVTTQFGVEQRLPTGASYTAAWNGYRSTSTNIFTTFDPLLNSNLRFDISQPLVRDFKVDQVRKDLDVSKIDRQSSDLELQSSIVLTTRNVKNAYWDLTYQIDNLKAVRQSLELAQRVLVDNQRRVQVGTMAPIDIIEAQSEVARNEESVIVAEAAIDQAEDRLRSLIFDPDSPEFWTLSIEPAEDAPFQPQALDVDSAIRRALDHRIDMRLARNTLSNNDINVKYFRNQILPSVDANFTYVSTAAGGTQLTPLTQLPVDGSSPVRDVVSRRSFGSVLGDTFSAAYPAWTFGLSFAYPLGTSSTEATLARARLQQSQAATDMKNLEMQVALEVRSVARQVQTNQKRVDSTRLARELAERRLEAAEKKFAAGIETNFFVFQAQRDLTQARTGEVRAIADYNKSLVDFEAVQETSIAGTRGVTAVR
ncbi:MAG TPA: TolC family protein [Vicinamibacterales bacterium]|nr:TolC family protein [Vicinamibacterales bacterium]